MKVNKTNYKIVLKKAKYFGMELMQRRLRYSSNRSYNLYHLCYYFSKSSEIDADRKLILDFKRFEEPAVRHLIIEAIENLQSLQIDNEVMVIRALNSLEMRGGDAGTFALDRLGMSLAAVYDCNYLPSIIYKKRKIPSIKSFGIAQRKAALDGNYGFDAQEFSEYDKLLIIDDVVTTGSTACAIMQPVLQAYPKTEITVFSLAWTPTRNQQEYILEMQRKGQTLNEPEAPYGQAGHWFDQDFEQGETNVTF